MKLYSYSGKSLAFAETGWTRAKLVGGGVFIGSILFLGIMELNHSAGNTPRTRPTIALTAENDILRQQLDLMAPRLTNLEIQAGQLEQRGNELRKLLLRRKSVQGTMVRFTNAAEQSKVQPLMAAAKNPLP